ncbi:MAG: helix-turn-helix domain-containing protein [Spirochaetaceae bacterium]|nr:helix-turn-helix domain-containing protein [Spirochaetaceae bacterium]
MKKRIGLILASIHTGAAVNMWASFVQTAEAQDRTLFVFPGGLLGVRTDLEYLRNSVYALANTRNLDGMVSWSSTIGFPLSHERLDAFHAAFEPLPYLTIAEKAPGRPCLNFDAYKGMKELVGHFINEHGARRIAFLRGPEHHVSAQDRLQGYRDALQAANLSYDGRLVTGPFGWENGDGAAAQLVESRGLLPGRDFDTLIGSSDMMTVPAIQYLHERGYTMAKDYRAGGFNNSAESEILPHPLSTVRMPYMELAGESLRILKDLMNGNGNGGRNSDGGRVLPCEVVIRESCGCLSADDHLSAITKYIRAQYEREKRRDVLNSLKTELLGSRDRQSLILSLARHLPRIGIFTAAVLVYLSDTESECVGSFSPEGIAEGGTRFAGSLLFPPEMSGQYADGAFLVQPLFTETRSLGHILTNIPFPDGRILEELRSCVSGALKGIFLTEQLLQKLLPKDISAALGILPATAATAVDAQTEKPKHFLFVGFEDRWTPSWAENAEQVHIYSHKDFADTVAQRAPALILLGSMDAPALEALETVRRHPVTAMTPVLVLPEKIETGDSFTAICRFPRTLLCNRGPAAFAAFGTRALALADNGTILPPRTGALIKKTILLFNHSPDSYMSRIKIARAVKTSEDYLTRIFRREMGFSLWEYLNSYRVCLAADMLMHTGCTVYEAALKAGFPDQSYFARVFKKTFNKAPSEIRKPAACRGATCRGGA